VSASLLSLLYVLALPAFLVMAGLAAELVDRRVYARLQSRVGPPWYQPLADSLFDRGEYAASLRELAVLKGPVDAFFDQVMVNVDEAPLRANRLGLLAALHAAMNRVADLARLAA